MTNLPPPIKKELTPYTKRELSRRVYKINFNEFLAEYSEWLDYSELKSVNNYLSYARTLEKDVFLKWYADEDYDYLLNLVLAQRNSDMEAYKDVKQWGATTSPTTWSVRRPRTTSIHVAALLSATCVLDGESFASLLNKKFRRIMLGFNLSQSSVWRDVSFGG